MSLHDQMRVVHCGQDYYVSDAVSFSVHHLGRHRCQTVPSMVMFNSYHLVWGSQCLQGLSTVKLLFSCFLLLDNYYLQVSIKRRYFKTMEISCSSHFYPIVLAATDGLAWINWHYVSFKIVFSPSFVPFTFIIWHSTLRKRFSLIF